MKYQSLSYVSLFVSYDPALIYYFIHPSKGLRTFIRAALIHRWNNSRIPFIPKHTRLDAVYKFRPKDAHARTHRLIHRVIFCHGIGDHSTIFSHEMAAVRCIHDWTIDSGWIHCQSLRVWHCR